MKRLNYSKIVGVISVTFLILPLLISVPSQALGQDAGTSGEIDFLNINAESGLSPENFEGFEEGHYELFAPNYIGDSKEWIRPTVEVVWNNTITGNYSLRWQANKQHQEWVLASNSFYIAKPFIFTAKVRVEASQNGNYGLGIAVMESKENIAALRLDKNGASLDQFAWHDNEGGRKEFRLDPLKVYTLQLKLNQRGDIKARILNEDTKKILLEMEGHTFINPEAIGLYISTKAEENTSIFFDDIKIDSGPYRVNAKEWVRAPQLLALPRTPEIAPDQGNWVGGMTVRKIKDEYRMWYRIRDNKQRGSGYGLAISKDGMNWNKHESNPILTFSSEFDSNEKISVLKVDSLYQAWYALDTGPSWIIAYATSKDGIHWNEYGKVIEGYSKDADVVYVDGTYYLYAIAPTKNKISIYTSADGVDWNLQNTLDMGAHRHPAAYYVDQDREFQLYAFGGGKGVSIASSIDGIHFRSFQKVWSPSKIGLDDWQQWGIDYGAFPTDRWGHLQQNKNLIMYYQARHAYNNNHGTWKYHGDGKILIAGNFSDLFVGVPVSISPKNTYRYHTFPYPSKVADGLAVTSSGSIELILNEWDRSANTITSGVVNSKDKAQIRLAISGLKSNTNYNLRFGENVKKEQTNDLGNAVFIVESNSNKIVGFTIDKSN